MYLTIHWFVFGHSDPEKSKRAAKEQAIDRLVNNDRVDYVKDPEAFALNGAGSAAKAEIVLDDIENKYVYGELGPVRGSSGENRYSLQNLTDEQCQTGYMVDLAAHVKPGDDLFPETASSNEVTVDKDDLEEVLNFVEWDSALDHAPEDSDVLEAIASLRDDLDQEPEHGRVQKLAD